MKMKATALSHHQIKNVEAFLSQFADIEKALKRKLRLHSDDRTAVSVMAKRYGERNPYWRKSEETLLRLAEIRNLLTHQRGVETGYPVALAGTAVKELGKLHAELTTQTPCSKSFKAQVQVVHPKDSLASVVEKIYEFEFSQFPVIDGERFAGLITENEIVHWLGHCVKSKVVSINLAEVDVSKVLKEKGPYRKASTPFRFAKLDSPEIEVMSLFARDPSLEVVLLTESGRSRDKIEGIITEWDAARFVEMR